MKRKHRIRKALAASENFWGRLLFPKKELFKAFVELHEKYESHAVHHALYVSAVEEAARRQREP